MEQPISNPFQNILDNNEKIIWMGTPKYIPYLLTCLPWFIFSGIWYSIFRFFVLEFMIKEKADIISINMVTAFSFIPLVFSILVFSYEILAYKNTHYALTNRRILFSSGAWGIDFKTMDYDKIIDMEVNVGPLQKQFGVGTIVISSGQVDKEGKHKRDSFYTVEHPYEVFKTLKQISADVKTDFTYPNAFRPDTNPGYQGDYAPK